MGLGLDNCMGSSLASTLTQQRLTRLERVYKGSLAYWGGQVTLASDQKLCIIGWRKCHSPS